MKPMALVLLCNCMVTISSCTTPAPSNLKKSVRFDGMVCWVTWVVAKVERKLHFFFKCNSACNRMRHETSTNSPPPPPCAF